MGCISCSPDQTQDTQTGTQSSQSQTDESSPDEEETTQPEATLSADGLTPDAVAMLANTDGLSHTQVFKTEDSTADSINAYVACVKDAGHDPAALDQVMNELNESPVQALQNGAYNDLYLCASATGVFELDTIMSPETAAAGALLANPETAHLVDPESTPQLGTPGGWEASTEPLVLSIIYRNQECADELGIDLDTVPTNTNIELGDYVDVPSLTDIDPSLAQAMVDCATEHLPG